MIESGQEPDRTGPPLDVRVGHARVDVRPHHGGGENPRKPSHANSEMTLPQFGPVRAGPGESAGASGGADSCVVIESAFLSEAID